MSLKIVETTKNKYLLDNSHQVLLSSERDINDLISRCWENDTNIMMLHQKSITDDFFNLKTGLAGIALQKFTNYNIKLILVIEKDYPLSDRFQELLLESNKGNNFRVFNTISDAEKLINSL